mgnify:FL=1
MFWIAPAGGADALWSAEQILHSGSCGALLLWQSEARAETLRRLHLAAQGGSTVFWLLRPLAAAGQASPAPLRLGLLPAAHGIAVDILKRRGPRRDAPLYLRLDGAPFSHSHSSLYATLDSRAPALAAAGNLPAVLG